MGSESNDNADLPLPLLIKEGKLNGCSMPESLIASDKEIFTIPPEFYGGALPSLLPKTTTPVGAPRSPSGTRTEKTHFKVPRVAVIGVIALLFLLAVGAISWYYFRQARPPKLTVSKPPVVEIPQAPSPIETPIPVTTTPIEPASVAEPPNAPLDLFSKRTYTLAEDTDGDGLSNGEELFYNTNPALPDTDSDGYVDGLEVRNAYNPSGIAPERLIDAGLALAFTSEKFGYSILYPRAWLARALDDTETEVMISPPQGGEFFEALVEENPDRLPVSEWFLEKSPGANVSDLISFTTKSGLSGVKSADRLNAYIAVDDKVFILVYNIGTLTSAQYVTTFDLLLHSFSIIAAPPSVAPIETSTSTL